MMLKDYLSITFKYLLVIILPFFLFFSNVCLLFSPAFIRYEYNKKNFPKAMNFSDEERLLIAESVLFYVRDGKDIPDNHQSLFREKELSHLSDTRYLTGKIFTLHKILALLIVFSLLTLFTDEKSKRKIPVYIFFGCLLTVFLVGFASLFIYTSFEWFFIKFHQILFSPGTWTFYASDVLIQLFPQKFWFDAVLVLLLLTIGEGIFIGTGMCTWIISRKKRSRKKRYL